MDKQYYSLREAASILGVSPKTVYRLVERATNKWSGFKQPPTNPMDRRQRLLSRQQIEALARFRQEELDENTNARPSPEEIALRNRDAIASLTTNLTDLALQLNNRLKDMEVQLDSMMSALAREGIMMPDRYRPDSATNGAERQHQRRPLPEPDTARTVEISRRTQLPPDLIPWRSFARLHGIPEATVQGAIQRGSLEIIKAKSPVDVRPMGVLDQAGRANFYRLFAYSPNFRECPACPHNT